MEFTFIYEIKDGNEHISYALLNDEDYSEVYGEVGNIEDLIKFIKEICRKYRYVSASFDEFSKEKINYVLKSLDDEIEYDYTIHDNSFNLFEKTVKKRGV